MMPVDENVQPIVVDDPIAEFAVGIVQALIEAFVDELTALQPLDTQAQYAAALLLRIKTRTVALQQQVADDQATAVSADIAAAQAAVDTAEAVRVATQLPLVQK